MAKRLSRRILATVFLGRFWSLRRNDRAREQLAPNGQRRIDVDFGIFNGRMFELLFDRSTQRSAQRFLIESRQLRQKLVLEFRRRQEWTDIFGSSRVVPPRPIERDESLVLVLEEKLRARQTRPRLDGTGDSGVLRVCKQIPQHLDLRSFVDRWRCSVSSRP